MEEFQINNYRYRAVAGKFLITTDSGKWFFLSEDELNMLKSGELSTGTELFLKLKQFGVVLVKENILTEIDSLRKRNSFILQGASLHHVIPTMRCNHRCAYCHAGVSNNCSEEMTEETAKKVVDFIFQSPSKCITIEFQGGEPMLRFDIVKFVVIYAKKKNMEFNKDLKLTIVTNLSLMDEEKLDFFIKNEVTICTSLDGSRKLHDFNRKFLGEKSSYDMVKRWSARIKSEYEKRGVVNTKLNAILTVTRESLKYSKEIVDEYLDNKFRMVHLRFLNNLGDARESWNDISYSSEEFIDFWKRSMDYIIKMNLSGKKIIERGAQIILKKFLNEEDPNYLEMRSPCGACIGQLAYTPEGKVYSCDEARMLGEELFCVGDVRKDAYKDVLGCSKSCSIISSSVNDCFVCDACVYKPYCGICPVCNYAEQGSLVAKIPDTPRCKIYMAQFDYLIQKLQDKEVEAVFKEWVPSSQNLNKHQKLV